MKKMVILATALAVAISSSTVYAKGFKMKSSGSFPAVQTKSKANTQQQKDADFNNTAYKPIPNSASTQNVQTAKGANMNGLVTGIAAGYLLNEALSSNEAQAQTKPESAQSTATPEQMQVATPAIPSFKALEPQTDPYLIEKTTGYLRYCLNGVQYLVPTANSQLAPTLMVDKNNAPVQCVIVP